MSVLRSPPALTGSFVTNNPPNAWHDFNDKLAKTPTREHSENIPTLGLAVYQHLWQKPRQPRKRKALGELAEQLEIEMTETEMMHVPIYQGGPVQTDRGFVLHQPLGDWDNSMQVTPDISLTMSQDILEAIAQGLGPDKYLIMLGYAGWGEGQLEEELVANAWLNGPADVPIIFDTPAESRWTAAAAHLGVELNLLSSDMGHA